MWHAHQRAGDVARAGKWLPDLKLEIFKKNVEDASRGLIPCTIPIKYIYIYMYLKICIYKYIYLTFVFIYMHIYLKRGRESIEHMSQFAFACKIGRCSISCKSWLHVILQKNTRMEVVIRGNCLPFQIRGWWKECSWNCEIGGKAECLRQVWTCIDSFVGRFPSFAQVNFTLDYLDARFYFLKSWRLSPS